MVLREFTPSTKTPCLLLLISAAIGALSDVICIPDANSTGVLACKYSTVSNTSVSTVIPPPVCSIQSAPQLGPAVSPATVCDCSGSLYSTLSAAASSSQDICGYSTLPSQTIKTTPLSCSAQSASSSGFTLPAEWCTCNVGGPYPTAVGQVGTAACSYRADNSPVSTITPTAATCSVETAPSSPWFLPTSYCACGANTLYPTQGASSPCAFTTAPSTTILPTRATCSVQTAPSSPWYLPTSWCGCGANTLYPTQGSSSPCAYTTAPSTTISPTIATCTLTTTTTASPYVWPLAWCGCGQSGTDYPTQTSGSPCAYTAAPATTVDPLPVDPTPSGKAQCFAGQRTYPKGSVDITAECGGSDLAWKVAGVSSSYTLSDTAPDYCEYLYTMNHITFVTDLCAVPLNAIADQCRSPLVETLYGEDC